jgi:hypothetical protein
MKDLARHIELLLRDNDCVILPGFGGFIAHDVPAYYVSDEGLYYPPSRSISFNASITMNDGLLAQSYMKSYQVDYARANYMIDVAVEQLTDLLDEEGTAVLPRIGRLTQDINQSLQFTPDEAGIASPLHFGLSSFAIKELALLMTAEMPREVKPAITHTAKTIDLHIRKDVLHRVASTAAVFLLLLMVALPTGVHKPTDIAALHLTEIIAAPQVPVSVAATEVTPAACDTMPVVLTETAAEELAPAPMETEPAPLQEVAAEVTEVPASPTEVVAVQEVLTEPTPAEPVAEPIIETPAIEPAPVAVATSGKTYHIIVASLPSHRGADETLNQYTRMGYAEASIVERDNRVRISLMQFADKDEANEQLKTLRQNEKFQNAWLLSVRN